MTVLPAPATVRPPCRHLRRHRPTTCAATAPPLAPPSCRREAFRVVNGEDIVARLPRHGNSAGAVLDYEHCGRTVLIDEDADAAAQLVGSALCPARRQRPICLPGLSEGAGRSYALQRAA